MPARDLRADAVFTPAELRAVNVPDAAQLLAINGALVATRAEAIRQLGRRAELTVLYVQHQGRRFFAALPPRP